ncbi:hypothetical protein [Xanthobacter agilis]|uniref:Uncharacterized protein n=1 Tax=Xanthobacter agilis TaxID=47492 RepID=A0ABU0LHE6_XANAG|nr:hypothetical protein [Xanthobacter agilis]MDQ0506571.1 hypothetical protein [Xanthobacter agilis]
MRTALRLVLATLALPVALGASGAGAQSLPTLEQYPLRDRVFGPGGAFFPNYVTPSMPGISYMTGMGPAARLPKGAIFGAATMDFLCQQSQAPTIAVVSAPPGARISVSFGPFVATGTDGGATNPCLGHPAKGAVVSFKGRRAPGQSVTLRVTYPTLGAWYDHVVPVPAR